MRLIRCDNLLPAFLLNLSGGFIINPSFNNLLHNTNFILSSIITSLIMSTSMIINDIYDIKIDKINNKDRPLITGEITKLEAITSVVFLSILIEYFNSFLSTNLQMITNVSLFLIYIYTPIIKRIFLVKNLFCAFLVSFSIFFSGMTMTTSFLFDNKNYELFLIELSLIFFGSLYNEILLDITDITGDKTNGINTIPVIVGKKNALILECLILLYNMVSSFLMVSSIVDIKYAFGLQLIFIPFIYDLYKIFNHNLDNAKIKQAVKNTSLPLFLSIIYICSLQFFV
jgi:geranylgeranylglycerol-phosphate geranylgeranyltransferase